jgi:hypothetical protein
MGVTSSEGQLSQSQDYFPHSRPDSPLGLYVCSLEEYGFNAARTDSWYAAVLVLNIFSIQENN